MATSQKACANKFTHDNFTASTVASARSLPSKCNFILVDNRDANIAILVSLDNGVTYKTITTLQSLSLDGDNIEGLNTLLVKSASSTVSVECLYGSEK